jgi:hypothetical protein
VIIIQNEMKLLICLLLLFVAINVCQGYEDSNQAPTCSRWDERVVDLSIHAFIRSAKFWDHNYSAMQKLMNE